MFKRTLYILFLIFSMFCFLGVVYGSLATDYGIFSHYQLSSDVYYDFTTENYKKVNKKTLNDITIKSIKVTKFTPDDLVKIKKTNSEPEKKNLQKIKKALISKPIFKSGANVNIKVFTVNSITSVKGSLIKIQTDKSLNSSLQNDSNRTVKYNYKFKKSKSGFWYYKLNTKKFKSGDYNFKIIANDNKKDNYTDLLNFTVDNIPPKIFSLDTDLKDIIAGEYFTITVKSDNTTKKVIANIRGVNISLKRSDNETWTRYTNFSYKELGKIAIKVYAYDELKNFQTETTYIESKPKYVFWDGSLLTHYPIKVFYPNPRNAYEESVNELSKYATVYEGRAGLGRIMGNSYVIELGVTYKIPNGNSVKYDVIIAHKDPFVVYHEMAHVLNWEWSEYNCNWYAYNRTAYWYSNLDNSKFQ